MFNAQQLEGHWNQIQGKVKEKWGQLTDDDLRLQEGGMDQLIGRIQQRTGEGRESIERFLSGLSESASGTLEQVRQTAAQGYEQARAGLQQGYESAEGMVTSHPTESMATVFGIGLAVGVLAGMALFSHE